MRSKWNDSLLAIIHLQDRQWEHFMASQSTGRNLAKQIMYLDIYSQLEYLPYLDRNTVRMKIIFLECHTV